MTLNPKNMVPVTKLSFEKYASATTVLQIGRSRSALRDGILRYQPVSESGSFMSFVHFGLLPLGFSVNVCSALRNTTSLASASTTESSRNSRPRFIADAQPDQNQSRLGVFFPDFDRSRDLWQWRCDARKRSPGSAC